MSSAETIYTFRREFPDVLQRGRDNRVQMPAYLDGVLVAPTAVGSLLQLLDSGGGVVSSPTVSVVASIATATVPAAHLPSTLSYGSDYREVWTLAMPDGSVPDVPQEACVARMRLYPPTGAAALLTAYPGLLTEFGGSIPSLQQFVDRAWGHIIRRLWSLAVWPEVVVSQTQLVEPLEERAYYEIMRALYRRTSGTPRWERLMDEHKAGFEATWARMSWRTDADQDGVADGQARVGAGRIVTPNVPPRHSAGYRDQRW